MNTDLTEEWRPVVGFESYYEVSNLGQVRSCARTVATCHRATRTVRGALKAQHTIRYGYKVVSLSRDGRTVVFKVHRLVLDAFVGPAPQGTECRHLDGNPANNAILNLTWGTHAENMRDIGAHGRVRRGSEHGQAKLNEGDVAQILQSRAAGESQRAIARRFGVTDAVVSDICRGLTWTHVAGVRVNTYVKARGERQGSAKLTNDAVRAIRRRRAAGERYATIAETYGLNKETVARVCLRLTWAHVPDEESP